MNQGEAMVASEADWIFFFFFLLFLGVRELGGVWGHLLQDASLAHLGCVRESLRLCVTPHSCTPTLLIPEGEVNELKRPSEETLYLGSQVLISFTQAKYIPKCISFIINYKNSYVYYFE